MLEIQVRNLLHLLSDINFNFLLFQQGLSQEISLLENKIIKMIFNLTSLHVNLENIEQDKVKLFEGVNTNEVTRSSLIFDIFET